MPEVSNLRGIGIDDAHLGREQRIRIEPPERGLLRKSAGHSRVKLDQRDAFNTGVVEDFPHRHTVTTA